METASRYLVAYAINALWQLPLILAGAELVARLLGRARGSILHRLWVGCLVLAFAVPALPLIHLSIQLPSFRSNRLSSVLSSRPRELDLSFPGQISRQVPKLNANELPGILSTAAVWLYLGSVLFAMGRLGWGIRQTQTLLRSARPLHMTPEVCREWEACLALFEMPEVKLMYSNRLRSPATVSWLGPIVLLPQDLDGGESTDLTAVFCHELAHLRRRDFLFNILIELFGVMLFYHPVFHWMQRRVQETRELACDDIAAAAMSGRHVYARSLLRLTQKMLSGAAAPQPGCALGIFEGEILERRIMNLLGNKPALSRLRAFSSIALSSLFFVAVCILSSSLGIKVLHAQDAIEKPNAPAGWFLAGSKPANYRTGVDKTMVENGQPSAYLRSMVPVSDGFGTLMQTIAATEYAGKRVRLRAWVRSQDLTSWAGIWMRADKGSTMVAFDNMQNRAIKGTQAWKECDVVLDIPADATGIAFGILMSGTGEVWMNDASFEVVGKDVPTTNIQQPTPTLSNHPTNLKFTE